MAKRDIHNYWKIAPGERGRLWQAQRDNRVIAVGWNEMGNLSRKYRHKDEKDKKRFKKDFKRKSKKYDWKSGPNQLWRFYSKIEEGDKVIAWNGKFIYGIGTVEVNGRGYKYDKNIKKKFHAWPVKWETKFWAPLSIDELDLDKSLKKLHGRTITKLKNEEDLYVLS